MSTSYKEFDSRLINIIGQNPKQIFDSAHTHFKYSINRRDDFSRQFNVASNSSSVRRRFRNSQGRF